MKDNIVRLPRNIEEIPEAPALMDKRFSVAITLDCNLCDGDNPECTMCKGTGHQTIYGRVSWKTITSIFKSIVNNFEVKNNK